MKKLEAPKNAGYAATIVVVRSITDLPNCDNVVGIPMFGYQSIVSKDTKVGELGILFTAETQLSEEYARMNNLHRHGDRNLDQGAAGYLEDSRRVKAIKFRGHQSNSLFMPLSSLAYLGIKPEDLNPGDTFDAIGGHEICRKYLLKEPVEQGINKNARKTFKRVESKFMPEHYDTDNYFRNNQLIAGNVDVIVTQKLHGTSIRIGNTIVKRKLTLRDKIAQRLGVKVSDTEFGHVYGSRKVIKDVNNPYQDHFYSTDLWTEIGKTLDDRVPENFILYGEVVGYTGGANPIQKNYTYDQDEGTNELYIYRVAVITNQGRLIDLPWDGVKAFCSEAGLKFVPELWRGKHEDFYVGEWLDTQYSHMFPQAIPLNKNNKFVDEGVCIRAEGTAPYILKAKSPIFLNHESKMLDEEVVDVEAEGSLV
jgi:hypothetical protein